MHTLQIVDLATGRRERRWDEAKTPYQRLKGTGVPGDDARAKLNKLYCETNPRDLGRQIYDFPSDLWSTGINQPFVA